MAEEQRSPLRVSFVRALILFMRALPQCPNHLQKAPPPSTSTLGVRIPHVNFEELKPSDHSRCIFWQSIQFCMPQTPLSVSYLKPFNLKKRRDKRKILPFDTYNEQDELLAKKAAEEVKFQPCLQRTFILVRRQTEEKFNHTAPWRHEICKLNTELWKNSQNYD